MAGWASGLVEANLPGTRWVVQAIVFLGLGFAFWLAVFPFYTWVPLLAQETAPYIFGFLLGMLPVGVLWIALGFLDSFTWLRTSFAVVEGLRLTGGLMVLTAGIWAAFQTNLARMLGYAILLENGYALLAISLNSSLGLDLLAASLVPRLVGIALWSFALAVYHKHGITAELDGLAGVLRRYPVVSSALALAYFSVGGLPLLASFPVRQPLLETLAALNQPVAVAAIVGNLGFLLGGYRLLAAMVRSDEKEWQISEGGIESGDARGGDGVIDPGGDFSVGGSARLAGTGAGVYAFTVRNRPGHPACLRLPGPPHRLSGYYSHPVRHPLHHQDGSFLKAFSFPARRGIIPPAGII